MVCSFIWWLGEFFGVNTLRGWNYCVYSAFTQTDPEVLAHSSMASDRPWNYRCLAAECLTLARQTSDDRARASLLAIAQAWLDLAKFHRRSVQHHVVRTAIGKELKSLYPLSHYLPPHFLALLAQLNSALKDDGAIG
jgi:hypothetical protein